MEHSGENYCALSHKNIKDRFEKRWGGTIPVLEILTVAKVTCHNLQRRRRGYVTFRGTAGAEGEGSSARHPHKRFNFHKTGQECEGCTEAGRERGRRMEVMQEEEQSHYPEGKR